MTGLEMVGGGWWWFEVTGLEVARGDRVVVFGGYKVCCGSR